MIAEEDHARGEGARHANKRLGRQRLDGEPRSGNHFKSGSRGRELVMFLFLTVVLAPVLAVAAVGGYGFVVWILQMIFGPPGPPAA
jgi:nitrate reductase NapE